MHPNFAVAVAAALPMVTAGVIHLPRDEPVPQAADAVVCPKVDEENRPSPHVLHNLKEPDLSEWEGHEDKMPFFKKYDPKLLLKFVDDFCEGKVKRDMAPCCQCDDDEDDCKAVCVDEEECKAICEMADDSAKADAPKDGEKVDATKEGEQADATKETGIASETDTENKTCDTSKTPNYQSAMKGVDFTAKDIIESIDAKWAKLQKPKNDKRGVPVTADDVLRWSQGEGEDYEDKRPELFKNIAAETQAKRDEAPKKKGGVPVAAEDVLRWTQGKDKDYQAKRPELFKNIAAETQAKRDETSGKKGGVHITVDEVMHWAKGNDKAYKAKRPEIFENITDALPNDKRSAEADGHQEDSSDEAKLKQSFQSVLGRSKAALESVEKVQPDEDDKVKTVLASLIATLAPLSPGMDNPDALIAGIVEANSESHEERGYTGEVSDVKLDIPSLIKMFEELWQAVHAAKEELQRLHEAGSQESDATTSASELESVIAQCEPIVNNINDVADIFDAIVDQLVEKDEKKPVTHVEPDSVAATADDLVRRDDWSNNPMFSVKSSPNRENPHRVAQGNAEKMLKDPHLHQ
ncbi:uncharacterized protein J7T54_002892 [Emericellopsis cladophorae]|uniref:Uncharacterized protein n=1 Tax=Emericellopsis cladophorae TaxID=2686198 RepID=A0A9Q0BC15_9HYPO|nr:uncharacterized protein J7T54_002892 [Emericellopsis cladophorae]KAI6778624.1 hypothetical protein J7T54_002892 [Emericellopsis cladophorae]